MAETFINVTEGSGKKAHGWDRTIGANTVIDEYVQLGETGLPTYSTISSAVSTATANSHMFQLMAGASLPVRIRRIWLTQFGAPGAATAAEFTVVRLTTAGTGGTAVTPRPFDTTATPSGATSMTLPTAKGTEGVFLLDKGFWLGTLAIPIRENPVFWEQLPNAQPWIIPAGTANGIAIKNITAVATSTVIMTIEFTEANFV